MDKDPQKRISSNCKNHFFLAGKQAEDNEEKTMNALSKLFEVLHLSRGEMTLRRSHRRRRSRRQGSALSCETLEPKQLLAADVAVQFTDQVFDTTDPLTVAIEGKFQDTAVSGTVVKFETNAPLADDDFYVELTDNTPLTNANFLSYVNSGAYDNSKFHRSVSDFVIQGGGFKAPTVAADQPGSDPVAIPTTGTVQNEPGNLNTRGTIAMAKLGGQPDSATSQFFFNLSDNSFLDSDNGGYTQFGSVLGSGMTVVDTIGSALTYDATTYYSNTALSDLPLWNVNQDNIVRPQDFVQIENADVVTESALFTYQVTSSDSAKLTASFDGNGNLVLTPASSATGSVDVTVTATSKLDNNETASDTFSVQLNGGGDGGPVGPELTTIEDTGNTTLAKDADGGLYANGETINRNSQQWNVDSSTQWGYSPVAVENDAITSTNLLLQDNDGYSWVWELDQNWNFTGTRGVYTDSTATSWDLESFFNYDIDDDGTIGLPQLEAIESNGAITLNKDSQGRLYANTTPITRAGKQLTDTYKQYYGYTVTAAEVVEGLNRMYLKHNGGYIWELEFDSNWNYQRTTGVYDDGTTGFFNAEVFFNTDINEDGITGTPPRQSLESAGRVAVEYGENGILWIGGRYKIIRNNGALRMNSYDNYNYTPAYAETVDGVGKVVLKNDAGYIWVWTLDASWVYQSGTVYDPGTTGFLDSELEFGGDLNGDGAFGATIESAGTAELSRHSNGFLYARGKPLKRFNNHVNENSYSSSGYSIVAAETVDGQNRVLAENSGGYLWVWNMDTDWAYQSAVGVFSPNTDGFGDAEIEFDRDCNADNVKGVLLENQGAIAATKHSDGRLYVNNQPLRRSGSHVRTNTYSSLGYSFAAVDIVDGEPQALFKNSGGYAWNWKLSNDWNFESTISVPNFGTPELLDLETKFGLDVDGDTFTGTPQLTPIESFGASILSVTNEDGRLFVDDVPLIRFGNQVKTSSIPTGYSIKAAETVNDQNRVVLLHDNGYAWVWSCDASWIYTGTVGVYDPGTVGFTDAETQFGVSLNS